MPTLKMAKKKSTSKARNKTQKTVASPGLDLDSANYARMLADPCEGPLTKPKFGGSESGYLTRFRSTYTYTMGSEASPETAGYTVWYPDWSGREGHDGASTERNGGLYTFTTESSATPPVNTATNPLGSTSATTGSFARDPCWEWVYSDSVQDARCVAACVQFLYTGPMQETAGRVGTLTAIPRDTLLTGSSAGPISPNDLLSHSPQTGRTPLEELEVKYRPSILGQSFRSEGAAGNDSGDDIDHCFVIGVPGTSATSLPSGGASGDGSGIGFVWAGLPAGRTISLTFTKVIEWRPNTGANMVIPVPRVLGNGGNNASRVVAFLDKFAPDWQTSTTELLRAGAGQAARFLWSNVAPKLPLMLTL